MFTNFAYPMTSKQPYQLLRSVFKADSPNFMKLSDVLFLPGVYRFIRFWLSPRTNSDSLKLEKTGKMIDLLI